MILRFVQAVKKIDPLNHLLSLTLSYGGDIATDRDAMAVVATWFVREIRSMGYDPVILIAEFDKRERAVAMQ